MGRAAQCLSLRALLQRHHRGTTDYLCCASSRGRRSKCRGGSSSVVVVTLMSTSAPVTFWAPALAAPVNSTLLQRRATPCRQAASRCVRIAFGRPQFEVKDVELALTDVFSSVRLECVRTPSGVASPAPVVEHVHPAPTFQSTEIQHQKDEACLLLETMTSEPLVCDTVNSRNRHADDKQRPHRFGKSLSKCGTPHFESRDAQRRSWTQRRLLFSSI